jgi:hypothetical protein
VLAEVRTWKLVDVLTTWTFVTMSPLSSKIIPDPMSLWLVVSTMDGRDSLRHA